MLAARACVTVQLNVRDPTTGDQRQPDFVLDGVHTRIIGDVVITHPAAPSRAERCAREALYSAAQAEKQKDRKYSSRAERGYKLCHVSLESSGGMGMGVRQVIRALATEAEGMSVMSAREFTAWSYAALSVALQSGNGLVVDGGVRSARAARGSS